MIDGASGVPSDADPHELLTEAKLQVAAFLREGTDPEAAAAAAHDALHRADEGGVQRDELADGLEVTPNTLNVLLDGDVELLDLHPTRTASAAEDQNQA